MFDIKKAVEAALSVSCDRTKRGEFAQFLLRLSDDSLAVSQWRTVGGVADMIERFLAELGFGPDDFELYVSKLDPSVRDFRWGNTGKYEALRHEMSVASARVYDRGNGVTDSLVHSIAYNLFAGNDVAPAVALLPSESDEVLIGTDPAMSDGTGRRELPHLAELGAATERAFLAKMATLDETPEKERTEKWVRDYERARWVRFLITNQGYTSALADLGEIETMVRTLGLINDAPDFWVFSTKGKRAKSRSILRYLVRGETLPGEATLFSGIAALDYSFSCDYNGNKNPLRGFYFDQRETDALVDVKNKDVCAVFSFEAIDQSGPDTLSAYEFAADPVQFWSYVRALYTAFFGSSVKVALHTRSRLAFANTGDSWKAADMPVNSRICVDRATDTFGIDTCDPLAIFAIVVTANGRVLAQGKPESIPPRRVVKIQEPGASADESQFMPVGVLRSEIPYEWYDYIHRCNGPSFLRGFLNMHTQTSEELNLQVFRNMVVHRPTPERLREEANYDTSHYLKPEPGRYGSLEYNSVSATVSGIGFVLMTDSAPREPGQYERSQRATAFWDGSDAKGHGRESVISAVYSGIAAVGTHFGKLMNPTQDGTSGGGQHQLNLEPSQVDAWVKDAVSAQVEAPPEEQPYGRVLVVETNLKAGDAFPSGGDDTWRRIGRAVVNGILLGQNDPRIVNRDGPMEPSVRPDLLVGSFIHGVSHQTYLADAGSTAFVTSEIHPDTSLRIRWMKDTFDRIYIVIGLFDICERQAAMMYRWRTGLPLVEASVLARLSATDDPFVFVVNRDRRNEPGVLDDFLTRVIRTSPADDGSEVWHGVPFLGVGPWFRDYFWRTGSVIAAPARTDYNGWDMDFRSYVTN